ncbi:acyl-CoA dehydrogenase family protein [Nocardia sp. NPDC059236]
MNEGEMAEFREHIRQWLRTNLSSPEKWGSIFTVEGLQRRRQWERQLFEAGYAVLSWPPEWGGANADIETENIFQEEYLAAGAPERLNKVALGMAGPTVLRHGSLAQQQRWLPGMADCDEIWCQGFSEPDAGSDLASLRTRGRVDGDSLVITGQKTWCTHGPIADWMFALVRTKPDPDPRGSLTFVMIPMDAQGVDVRPIRQLHGAPDFADVFFEDVRVPMENVIGEVGRGWDIARSTLRQERASGLASHVSLTMEADRLAAAAAALEERADIRCRVATAYATSRAFSAYVAQRRADPETDRSSVIKLAWSQARRESYEGLIECAAATPGGPSAELEHAYWHVRAAEIYGGSNEVQRNIIARKLLNLPAGAGAR